MKCGFVVVVLLVAAVGLSGCAVVVAPLCAEPVVAHAQSVSVTACKVAK